MKEPIPASLLRLSLSVSPRLHVFISITIFVWASTVNAHEGHRPLPTRGMEVNAETGSMILTKAARETLDVQTVEVTPQAIHRSIFAYGTIVVPWKQHAVIASSLSGRIVALNTNPGESVQAGQVLAELDSPELEQLQLELRAAQADVLLSTKLVASTELAGRSGAIPGVRLAEARAKLMQDQAAVKVASLKWKALGLPTEILETVIRNPGQPIRQFLQLTNPISGVVTHADLSLGKIVDPKEHLFEIIDHSTVWLKIGVLEKDLARVAVGQPVTFAVTSIPNHDFTGTVDVVDSFLDPETHLGIVWATLQNTTSDAAKLLPGMSGTVQVEQPRDASNDEPNVIPLASVIRDGAERFVLVEQEQTAVASTYQKQPVALGARSGDVIEIRGGDLFPGDRVVTRGSHELGSFFAKGVLTVSPEAARDIDLKVQPISLSSMANVITIDGVIDVPPTHRSVASAQLGGSIQSILVDRGARVHRGDVLAEISSQPLQNLQLELMKVNLDLDLQSRLAENLRSAVDGIAQRRLWETESLVNQLTSRRDAIVMQLRTAGLNAEQIDDLTARNELVHLLPVRAPIDGIIVGFDKFLGHVVRPDEPLFEVHDLSHAWVQGFVSERDFPAIHIGQTVRVRLVTSPEEVLGGTIVRSGQSISDDDRALSVWIELSDMPTFQVQHNMFSRISIETGSTTVGLIAPRKSIVHEGIRSYVFIQSADKTFERRFVETGLKNDRSVEIMRGLASGEMIAVSGASELQSGYAALK